MSADREFTASAPLRIANAQPAFVPGALSGASGESKWAARLVGAGCLLTLVYELAYLVFDRGVWWTQSGWPFFLHLLNIALFAAAVAMTLAVGPWMRRYWKSVAFSFSTVFIASSTALAIITNEREPLFLAMVLFLAGTGPFLSWGERTQALLSAVAIIAFAIAVAAMPAQPADPYQWLGIMVATAIGLFSTALERRLHRARRQAEEEALRSREVLITQERVRVAGRLASGIAHDLNNILNVIKLRLAVIAHDDALAKKHESRLRSIERAINDAALTVARVRELDGAHDRGGMETTRLSEVISEAIELARTTIEGNSSLRGAPIRIKSRVQDGLPLVYGSPSELRQALLNLLLNAYDAMETRGEIVVEALARDAIVAVTVSDDGPGIAPELLERIFDPFFTTKGTRGTGLGLWIVRSIMESIGGRIMAANRPARGAVITLELPVAYGVPENQGAAPVSSARFRFLLIDSDPENLTALREALVQRGHTVYTAQSSSEALEKISNDSYNVVLCDLDISGLNGWDLPRRVLASSSEVKFYVTTGWARELECHIPRDLQVRGVLSKPIDLASLERIASNADHAIPEPQTADK